MAFEDGVKAFQETSRDPHKKILASGILVSYTIQDVLNSVQQAKSHYEHDRGHSKTRAYLSAFSHRVMHYGNVLDVLVQHHPEYTSLAWGAMKIVFGVSIYLNKLEFCPELRQNLGCDRARAHWDDNSCCSVRCF